MRFSAKDSAEEIFDLIFFKASSSSRVDALRTDSRKSLCRRSTEIFLLIRKISFAISLSLISSISFIASAKESFFTLGSRSLLTFDSDKWSFDCPAREDMNNAISIKLREYLFFTAFPSILYCFRH